MFKDILPMLTLSIGAALAVGTLGALIRPRAEQVDGELDRPPLLRSLLQIAIGLVAAIWALVSLLS